MKILMITSNCQSPKPSKRSLSPLPALVGSQALSILFLLFVLSLFSSPALAQESRSESQGRQQLRSQFQLQGLRLLQPDSQSQTQYNLEAPQFSHPNFGPQSQAQGPLQPHSQAPGQAQPQAQDQPPSQPTVPTLQAVRVDRGPTLDGNLDDEAWKQAVPFTAFRMVFPREGEPTETTELRIVYDESNLYLGLFCSDSQPARISANTMAHDAFDDEGGGDDTVKILLDPFLDRRNAYIFIVNARGARSEGLAFGEHSSLDWDGIWEARSRVGPDGWSTELKIPFKTISFKPNLPYWGLNVERYIPRKQETIRLSAVRQDNFFNNAAEAARLEGIRDLKLGMGLTFRPYGTSRVLKTHTEPASTDYQWDGGFDIYKNFTPNFVGALSYNTDFAETEVDERRINLTRFPLYFPEKRTFFLEGSEIFRFGTTSTESFSPFFSRRIGLYEGQQVPLLFGAKAYGRFGQTNLAFIDVMTDRFQDLGLNRQNFFAGRVYQNILAESKVGLIFTSGSPTGEKNTLAGVDLIYQTSRFRGNRNLSLGGWYVYNWNTIEAGRHGAFGFKIDYPNDLWDIVTSYSYYGDAVDPGLGFLPRKNVQTYSFGLAYMPRPEKGFIGRAIRQFFHELRFNFYWDLAGRLETRTISLEPINFQTESGERFEFAITPKRDVLPYDFEVADGVVIPAGGYNFTDFKFEFKSASHRPVSLDLEHRFGQFYSGRLHQTELGLNLRLKGYASFEINADLVRGNLPQGRFSENVFQAKADFFLSPRLGLMNYIQYDDVSRELAINVRFRWELSPGNVIYLVYNKNWERSWDPMSRFLPLQERGVFKLQLSIRP